MTVPNLQALKAKIEELTQVKAAADMTRLDYEQKRAEILKAVQEELNALDVEYFPLLDAANNRASTLETELRQEVLQFGSTVKGSKLSFTYMRGRVSWDTEALDKYALAHPEVKAYRKEGAPTVSLRSVKE
jgi:hypothetical protein